MESECIPSQIKLTTPNTCIHNSRQTFAIMSCHASISQTLRLHGLSRQSFQRIGLPSPMIRRMRPKIMMKVRKLYLINWLDQQSFLEYQNFGKILKAQKFIGLLKHQESQLISLQLLQDHLIFTNQSLKDFQR